MSWFYHPYPLGETAFVAAPIKVTLANRANRQGAYDPRRATDASVFKPAVVSRAQGPQGGIGIQLAPSPRQGRRAKSRLFGFIPPPIIPDLIAGGPGVRLAPQPRQPRRPQHVLAAPTVVYVRPINFGPGVRLAPQPTQGRAAHWKLSPPTVVLAKPLARPLLVHLAYSVRGKPLSGLGDPVVIDPNPAYPQGPMVQLVASPRQGRVAHSKLGAPAVIATPGVFVGPSVTLAYSLRGKAKSRLLAVPSAFRPVGQLVVHLAPSKRGTPKSVLSGPVVIGGGIAYSGPRLRLVNPLDRVPPTMSRLAPPAVLVAAATFSGPTVTLAYSLRGKPKSRLLPVPSAFQPVGQLDVHLAPSKRGTPKSLLSPPAVVGAGIAFPGPGTRLTTPRSTNPAVHSILREPVVVQTGEVFYGPQLTLAPSRRGKPRSFFITAVVVHGAITLSGPRVRRASRRTTLPVAKYRLGPPVVVQQAQTFAGPVVTLAPSRRGQPKSILRPPVDTVGLEDQGRVAVHLTRIRPVRTLAILREPVVVNTAVELSGPETWLAYSRRGTPKSILRPPLFGAPVPKAETTLSVTLAYSLRGKAKPRLPQVVYGAKVYAPISVTLAPSRFPRPKSRLSPPAVVAGVIFAPVSVHLAYSPRGKAKPKLTQVVYGARVYAPIRVTLAPSRFPTPKSKLLPPAVVTSVEPVHVSRPTLVRIRPVRTVSFLRPPAVIDLTPQTYFLATTFVRIRPPRTMWLLREPVVVVEECYGAVVCGFDFAAEVCGVDTAAIVTGTQAAGQSVSGSDSAATVEGATARGGSVTGGDERREGC